MADEKFTTTSGKEITVHISESGEPQSISWVDGEGKHTLSENEIFDIYDYLDSLDSD